MKKTIKIVMIMFVLSILSATFVFANENTESTTDKTSEKDELPLIYGSVYYYGKGWSNEVDINENDLILTTTNKASAIKFNINDKNESSTSITYRVYLSGTGWTSWVNNNEISGVTNKNVQIEAIQINFDSDMKNEYDIYYKATIKTGIKLRYAKNGETSGSINLDMSIKTITFDIVKKGNTHIDTSSTKSYNEGLSNANISYSTHVQKKGNMPWVNGNTLSGTTGQGLRVEGISIKLSNTNSNQISGGITYSVHTSGIGWMKETTNGRYAGTTGQARAIEAIKINLTGEIAKYYDIYYRVHSQHFGWLGWTKNGLIAGTTGYGYRMEAIQIQLVRKTSSIPTSKAYLRAYTNNDILYRVHAQNVGTTSYVTGKSVSGTIGKGCRLEAIWIGLNTSEGISGDISYSTHLQGMGWTNFTTNNKISGTTGQARRMEAIKIQLTGEISKYYDIYYRVHSQHFGWLGWAKNGQAAGTAGYGYRMEAIQIQLVRKTSSIPTSKAYLRAYTNNDILYRVHAQNVGTTSYVTGKSVSGTIGKGCRLEAIWIGLNTSEGISGDISYSTHLQGMGWTNFTTNNKISGTTGQARRMEAIKIQLTGEISKYYDIYYRVHSQHFGWLGWAKNGQAAGTAGYGYRMEAIQIVLVKKGYPTPGSNSNYFKQYVAPTPQVIQTKKITTVPQLLQLPELPTGCESVALTIALKSYGFNLGKTTIVDNYLSFSSTNFVTAFRGNPYSSSGFGCLPPAIVNAANKFLSANGSTLKASDITGTSFNDLYKYIDQGKPIVIWGTSYMQEPKTSSITCVLNGTTYRWISHEHCMVLYGYNKINNTVYISDPLLGYVERNRTEFERLYNQMGMRAVVIK